MTELLRKEDVQVDGLREQAQRAVAVFRKLQPTLTSYARVLSKNSKVRVELSAGNNGSTDGTRISYSPPIALGDNTPHERRICNDRGSDGLMLCKACALREEVLVTIYHEIAHIAFDSFARISDNDKRNTIEFALKEISGPWAERIKQRLKDEWDIRSYIALAKTVNPYLPHLVNALEDARVNEALFATRKGVRKMFAADEARIFNKGFEVRNADGSVKTVKWNEEPLNSQVLVAVYSAALGYDYSNWFHDKVVEALNDSELKDLLAGMRTIRSASAVYNLSLKVLSRLRELGFLATETDPEPPPPIPASPEEEPEDESGDESSPSDSGEGASEDQSCPGADSELGNVPPIQESVQDDFDDAEGSDDPEGDDSKAGSDSSQPGDEGDADDSSGQAHGDSSPAPHEDHGHSDNEPSDGASDSESEAGSSSGDESEPDHGGTDVAGGDESSDESDGNTDDSGYAGGIAGSGDSESSEESSSSVDGDSSNNSSSKSGQSLPDEHGPKVDASSQGNTDSDVDFEPIDTGADDGYGGTEVVSPERDDTADPPYGSPEDLNVPQVLEWMGHAEKPHTAEAEASEKAIETAIVQGIYFTTASANIRGVQEYHYGKPPTDKGAERYYAWAAHKRARALGQLADLQVPEAILQPALLRTRRVFSDNRRGRNERNRRSGHINAKALGKRAPLGDDRLFSKRYLPGIKDYEVIIGGDISGSTVGLNLALEKRAIMAQAELLERVGIPFSVYCHTGSPKGDGRHSDQDLDIYIIKERHDKWDSKIKERLVNIGSSAYNLDGHAMEYLRKRAEESQATDKIILYYSDGKMPAENHDEELTILQREINYCRRRGITLLGVGIRTDSPARHGLETVQVDTDEDIPKVIQLLGKRLEQKQ